MAGVFVSTRGTFPDETFSCFHVFMFSYLLFVAPAAAAGGGGDAGVRQPGAGHERSAESSSV